MSSMQANNKTGRSSRWAAVGAVVRVLHVVLLAAAVGVFLYVASQFGRQASAPPAKPAPETMADIDWKSPESSVYCLSCHRPVGMATADLNVQRGHSQNVALNEVQLQAVHDMGTVVGAGDTLICMSCHKLDPNSGPYMLADTLAGSRLCQRCHPGHYAQDTPHDLRKTAPDEKNRRGQTVAEGGPCSACHLSHAFARPIVPSPLDPDGYCITCHQKYAVAGGHARTQRMEHPESHCLQCHNPHDMTHGEFLKKSEPDLCLGCHEGMGGGVAGGMHPLGPMEQALPEELKQAGATAGPDGKQVTCTTCHAVHDAGHTKLLVLEPDSNRLCLACHADKLQVQGEGVMPRHGQSPVLTAAQKDVVAGWGLRTGPKGELLCLSCHKVHRAEPQANLLAFKPVYGETCVACHPGEATVVGTPHDLRGKFPDAPNKAGLTPLAAGPCSACHMAHQFPRERVPGAGDPGGQCNACHLAGRVAQSRTLTGSEHPKTRCGECHNPHSRAYARFLSQPEPELCAKCHEDEQRVRGGPHDLTRAAHPEKWNETARGHGGVCLSCHVPHGGERPDLFRVAQGESVGNHDEVCLACHAETAWNAPGIGAIHPQKIDANEKLVELALVPTDAAGNLRMGCRTCHDPHSGAEPVHLARVAAGQPTEALCLHCHADKELIRETGHAPEKLQKLGFDYDSCKPCHAMHADREGTWGLMLSTRFLPRCEKPESELACVPCLSCHRENGPAPFQKVALHPTRPMTNITKPEDPGYMPLFNAQGHEDPQGEVVCRTCHVSHGRLDLLKTMARNPNMTPEQRHAIRAQVRPFIEPNLCTACHGPDARTKFLRFHDADQRKGGRPG